MGGTGVNIKTECLRVETEFILFGIWTSGRLLGSTIKEYRVSQN